MFYGEYHQNIDDKGRVIIPAKFRQPLGTVFYITKDLWNQADERCLCIYSQEEFDKLREKLAGLSRGPKQSRALSRVFYASVQDSSIDKQGRVLINADLKDHSKIPFLKIETDTTPQSGGQLRTRIEAYKETLEGLNGSMQSDKNSQKMSQNSSLKNSRSKNIIVAGIDSGSTSTDVVIMDSGRNILGKAIVATGMSASKSASAALEAALREAGLSRSSLRGVAATGYGREIIEMEKQTITEITCHAKGAHFLFPGIRTIIDIGGQDSKVIRIDEEGRVLHFVMNDKCAAGTGRFLEMQAKALGLSMEEMSRLGLSWKEDVRISSMCTVFAESEVISLVAGDTPVNDIIHGLNMAVAQKTESLVRRGKGEPAFAMTGGVSRNAGVVNCLESTLSSHMHISDLSQFCGAIGAALMLL